MRQHCSLHQYHHCRHRHHLHSLNLRNLATYLVATTEKKVALVENHWPLKQEESFGLIVQQSIFTNEETSEGQPCSSSHNKLVAVLGPELSARARVSPVPTGSSHWP